MRKDTRDKIFDFLDDLSELNYNEPTSLLVRVNFGLQSWEAAIVYQLWQEERRADEINSRMANRRKILDSSRTE